MPGIIVDIGTGDGKFAYQLARKNPDRLVIGIDPSHKDLEKISSKIYRKAAKGGIKNAFFVLSGVESLPEELDGSANQVFINFPWGTLLKGVVLAEEGTWSSIRRICRPGAVVDLVFGYDAEYEEKESSRLGLPVLDIGYIREKMVPALAARGFEAGEIRRLSAGELDDYPSSWAKKLRFSRSGREYFHMRLICR